MQGVGAFSMFLPAKIDNQVRYPRLVVLVFALVTAVSLWRSQHHIFAPDGGAQTIAGIPLDAFSDAAAANIITLFALWGTSQLLIALLFLAVLIRYRSLIPVMFVVTAFEYAGRLLIGIYKPLQGLVDPPPGALINLPVVILSLAMITLCVLAKSRQTK